MIDMDKADMDAVERGTSQLRKPDQRHRESPAAYGGEMRACRARGA